MNICLLTKTTLAHSLGGLEVHVETLSRMVPHYGHSLTIIASRHPHGIIYEDRNRCPTYYLPKTPVALYCRSFWHESVHQFLELHKKNKFDIVWANDFAGYYYAWKTKPLLRVPMLSILTASLVGHIRGEWNRVNTLHELIAFSTKFLPESLLFYSFWFWRTLRHSDAIIAVSRDIRDMLKREFKIPHQKIKVISHAVDTNQFKPDPIIRESIRKQYGLDSTVKLIIMAAVIHKQKGIQTGLAAFKEIRKHLPRIKLMVVGGGEHLDYLKGLTRTWQLDQDVIFCGAISNDQMPAYYNACDLFLNPTLRWEGLPITTIEAMACGKPIVISKIGGTPSTIEEGLSGFFVGPGDTRAIVGRCLELLKNPDLSEKMGLNARTRAVEFFNQEKMVEAYLSLSQEILEDAQKAG